MFCLNGKTALVTGSSRGIGAAIARGLAAAGADTVINHLDELEQAEAVCAAIRGLGRRALAVHADVRSESQVACMFETIDAEFGRLDILVNNAGVVYAEDIFNTPLEHWRDTIDTHLTGTFLCAREAMRRMRTRGYGRIIQISSVVGHQGAVYGYVHYAAAKAGMLGFTKTLARTGAPFGITVNAIAPGLTATEMFRQCHGEEETRRLAAMAPLGIGGVEDVAAAALYLASDEARHVTGAVLDVNGGLYYR